MYRNDTLNSIDFTAMCPGCGEDVRWIATKYYHTFESGAEDDSYIAYSFLGRCRCGTMSM